MDNLERQSTLNIHGRHVTPGTELSIRGNGRVRFKSLTTNRRTGAQWIDAIDRYGKWRSFHLSAVTTVHRLTKGR